VRAEWREGRAGALAGLLAVATVVGRAIGSGRRWRRRRLPATPPRRCCHRRLLSPPPRHPATPPPRAPLPRWPTARRAVLSGRPWTPVSRPRRRLGPAPPAGQAPAWTLLHTTDRGRTWAADVRPRLSRTSTFTATASACQRDGRPAADAHRPLADDRRGCFVRLGLRPMATGAGRPSSATHHRLWAPRASDTYATAPG